MAAASRQSKSVWPPPPPVPRINRYILFAIFCILLALCSGPAYNANAVKNFLLLANYFSAHDLSTPTAVPPAPSSSPITTTPASSKDSRVQTGLKIFQSCDVIMGAFIGPIFDAFGARLTQALGYLLFSIGLIMMMNFELLPFALALQGLAACTTLSSALHLANLFQRGGKFAMCLLTAVVELGLAVFPCFNALIIRDIITPKTCLFILAGLAVFGIAAALWLFAAEPFAPADERVREFLTSAESGADEEEALFNDTTGSQRSGTAPGLWPDSRDRWGSKLFDQTDQKRIEENLSSAKQSADFSNKEGGRTGSGVRIHGLSLSVASAAVSPPGRRRSTVLVQGESVRRQLLSPEFICLSLTFVFFLLRNNAFADFNEISFHLMGDHSGDLAAWTAKLMPFGLIPAVFNGLLMELIGVVKLMSLLNSCGIAMNLIGASQIIRIQPAAVILFLVARASVWSFVFNYCLERFGISHFVLITGVALAIGGTFNQIIGMVLNDLVPSVVRPVVLDWLFAIGGVFVYLPIWFLGLRKKYYMSHI